MSEAVFEMINSISSIWKVTIQAAMFLVLCQWMECGI